MTCLDMRVFSYFCSGWRAEKVGNPWSGGNLNFINALPQIFKENNVSSIEVKTMLFVRIGLCTT